MRDRVHAVLTISVWLALAAGISPRAWSAEPVDDVTSSAQTTDEKNQDLAEALSRFRDQDIAGAQKLLQEAVSQDKDLPPVSVILAEWYFRANQAQAARVALERAVLEAPADPESYVIMSDVALREGRFAEAELALVKAAALLEESAASPRRKQLLIPHVHANLAAVSEWRGDWAKAGDHLAAWLTIDARSAVAMQRLGRVLFIQGRRGEALRHLQAAAEADKTALNPDAMMGRLYEQAGERDQAKVSMDAAVQAAPADLKTRLAVSQWALEAGQLTSAQEHADAALEIDPSSLEAKHLRGMVALFQRDFKVAENHFQAVLIQSPSNFAASDNLAVALCLQDDEDKMRRALEYAQVNARQYPRQAQAYSTLGWILYRLCQREEAEKALRTAASSGTVSPDTAYYLARIEVDRDRRTEAKLILEAAVEATGLFLFRKEADDLLTQLTAAPVETAKPTAPDTTAKPPVARPTNRPVPPGETKNPPASNPSKNPAAPGK